MSVEEDVIHLLRDPREPKEKHLWASKTNTTELTVQRYIFSHFECEKPLTIRTLGWTFEDVCGEALWLEYSYDQYVLSQQLYQNL
jgi:hypothetical protein